MAVGMTYERAKCIWRNCAARHKIFACFLRGAPCHMHACTLIKLESAPAVHTSCGSLDVLCGAFRVCLPEQGHFAWLMGCCEYLEAAQCALGRQAF